MIGSIVVVKVLFNWFILFLCELEIGLFGLFDNVGIWDCVVLRVESIMLDVNDGVLVLIRVLIFCVLWL